MKNKRLIFVLLLTLNIVLIGIIYNVIGKNPIIIKESKVIKEMTETEYDSQITELNKSHTEYVTKVQENKKKIAEAITNQGVQTSENDTIETMTENIGNILQARTSDATATTEDIANGKTAYINGELVTGINNFSSGIKKMKKYSIGASEGTSTTTITGTIKVPSDCTEGFFLILCESSFSLNSSSSGNFKSYNLSGNGIISYETVYQPTSNNLVNSIVKCKFNPDNNITVKLNLTGTASQYWVYGIPLAIVY